MSEKPTYEELERRVREFEAAEVECKKTEAALRESRNKYRTLFEAANDAIIVASAETGMILDANQKAEQLTGRPRSEIIGMHQTELHPESQETYAETAFQKDAEQKNVVFYNDFLVRHADGRNIPVEISPSFVEIDGTPCVLGIFRDVSERKNDEKALKENQERLRTLFETISDAVYVHDVNGRILDFNQVACERLGYDREEMLALQVLDVDIDHRTETAVREKTTSTITSGPLTIESRHGTKHGGIIDVELNINTFPGPDGALFVTVARDITARKQAEETLRNSEARLKALSDASFESIFFSDKGVCIDQNLTAEKTFGYTRDEAIGRHGTELIAPEDRELVINNMMAGYEKPYRVNALRKDGTTFPCEIQGRMINHKGRALRVTALRDITEQKRAEEGLKASEQKFRNIADNVPGLVLRYKLNPDGGDELLYISKGVADLYEVSPEDAIKNNNLLWDRLHRDDLEEFRTSIKESAETLALWKQEHRIQLPDGRIKWVHTCGVPTKQEDGSVVWDTLAIDITEKKQREDALQKSLAFNKAIIDNSQDCIKILDLEGNLLFMNNGGQRLLEIENIEPYLNQSWIAFWKGDDYVNAEKAVQSAKEGRTGAFEGYCPTAKGTPKWWDILISPIMDNNGIPRQLLSVSRDITERKRAEQELRESEEQYRRLLDALEEGYLRADLQGHIVTANAAGAKLFGYNSPEEMLGVHMSSLYADSADRKTLIEKLKRERFLTNYELSVRAKNGRHFWTSSNIRLIVDENNEMAGTEALLRDITDIKIAEEALRESENRYRIVVQDQTEVISRFLTDGTFTFVNQVYCDFFGKKEHELLGKKWVPVAHPDDVEMIQSKLAEMTPANPVVNIENRVYSGKGRLHWFRFVNRGFFDSEGRLSEIQAVGRDISERKRAEAALQKSLAEKEVLLREIHHRVKNNMQAISGLLRMHARRTDDAHLTEIFDDCRNRIGAMSLIHEALYQSENLAKIDFNTYLKKLCRNLAQAHNAPRRRIDLRASAADVSLDMDQGVAVGMVIAELISNAFKHAFPDGEGGTVSVHLDRPDGETIQLIVSDTGKGLPEDFDIGNPPSLGMRLVVGAVTRELGGSIDVERDNGARFIIRFKCDTQ